MQAVYREWTSCYTINIDVCLNILVAAQHCVIWMYCHLFSQFLIGWIFRVCVVGCVLISWIASWPLPPSLHLPVFSKEKEPWVWTWAAFPVHQETKHLLKFLLWVFTLPKCVARWHIHSPVSLPILSRTTFLIRQTYLTQMCLFSLVCLF